MDDLRITHNIFTTTCITSGNVFYISLVLIELTSVLSLDCSSIPSIRSLPLPALKPMRTWQEHANSVYIRMVIEVGGFNFVEAVSRLC